MQDVAITLGLVEDTSFAAEFDRAICGMDKSTRIKAFAICFAMSWILNSMVRTLPHPIPAHLFIVGVSACSFLR